MPKRRHYKFTAAEAKAYGKRHRGPYWTKKEKAAREAAARRAAAKAREQAAVRAAYAASLNARPRYDARNFVNPWKR